MNEISSPREERAQLVLTLDSAHAHGDVRKSVDVIAQALAQGNVAAVILPRFDLNEAAYAEACANWVPAIQAAGAAALLDGVASSQILGRLNADGLLVEVRGQEWIEDALDLVQRMQGNKIIGIYGNLDRDNALTAGDIGPDLVHFGPLARDIKPEPHAKNLKLAEWWASMIEVPCLIPAGNSLESIMEASQTRAEFIVLSSAVFSADDPSGAVRDALELIANNGPVLEFDE
jgi:thiamine-phosphate pyrophosphorylase